MYFAFIWGYCSEIIKWAPRVLVDSYIETYAEREAADIHLFFSTSYEGLGGSYGKEPAC